MKYKALLIFSALISCGAENKDLFIDQEVAQFVNTYLSVAPNRGELDEMTFIGYGVLSKNVAVKCRRSWSEFRGEKYDFERAVIVNHPSEWNSLLQAKLYKQLGNCIHDLDDSDAKPGIMNSDNEYIEDKSYWDDNLTKHLLEMFEPRAPDGDSNRPSQMAD